MNADRAIEIATAALNRLMELNPDSGQRFAQEELDMDKDEVEFFGINRTRTATNITWEDGINENRPTEVDIPWDVLDDDIDSYLTDKYGFCVCSYDIEEED